MIRIFVSFSLHDGVDLAYKIRNYLRERGFYVFVAKKDIYASQKWKEVITDNLTKCDIFILVITPASLDSEFITYEVNEALRLNTHFIACRDESVELNWETMPWRISDRLGIEFENAYELLRKVVNPVYAIRKQIEDERRKLRVEQYLKQTLEMEIYTLTHNEKTFYVPYEFIGGKLKAIDVDDAFSSIVVSIESTDEGLLDLYLPRDLVDAKIDFIKDDDFIVLIDGKEVDFQEIENNYIARKLRIAIPKGIKEIEIIGTHVAITVIPDVVLDRALYPVDGKMHVEVFSPDSDKDPAVRDRIMVEASSPTEKQMFEFEETGPNTGTFERTICLTPDRSSIPGDVQVTNGEIVRIRFQLNRDAGDEEIAMVDGQLARVRLDKLEYLENDKVGLIIEEPDANKDSRKAESMEVRIWSTSDPKGLQVTLKETGPNTATFTGQIALSTDPSEGSNLQVRKDGTITISYVDRTLPRKIQNELSINEKEITFSAMIV